MPSTRQKPEMFTMAANIGQGDPWAMVPIARSVLLAPVSHPTTSRLLQRAQEVLFLDLTDLGLFGSDGLASPLPDCLAPLEEAEDLVLLMSTSLISPFHAIYERACSMTTCSPMGRGEGGWLATTHRFLSHGQSAQDALDDGLDLRSMSSSGSPFVNGSRRLLFGSLTGDDRDRLAVLTEPSALGSGESQPLISLFGAAQMAFPTTGGPDERVLEQSNGRERSRMTGQIERGGLSASNDFVRRLPVGPALTKDHLNLEAS